MLSDVDFALIQILEIGVGERLDIVQLGQFLGEFCVGEGESAE